ncbi:thioredoxin domain-containing protein [Numidum massiliense]|uniref:thioredoxin domain-containing protein n=1 Tax=Numidum massiliense TaxID=1522315 RepID=UPI0006D5506F|nr:thioredoxin domain-containing protein [Numidum massiliense]
MEKPNLTPNRLINEKSPYLLQHAYDPVDWYNWADGIKEAAKQDKLIFLSCGYSTCHWCHVMARESFADEEVATLLNREYVAIKVDREERPDIDHLYMTVCQMMTGHGGWPLTVLLTPQQQPVFAGTYFPKKNKWGRPGLLSILTQIADKWRADRDHVLEMGEKIAEAVKPHVATPTSFVTSKEGKAARDQREEQLQSQFQQTVHESYRQFAQQFDDVYGGFGEAPKFPSPHNGMFLLRYYRQTKEKHALEMVEKTLDGMYRGGMYDHIGYGFARYSTDEKWLVPHFEKMLYDNALLAYVYLEAYQVTGKEHYARVAEQIFTYVLRDMTDPDGGFYSAEDADSEGVEGKFYVWTPQEVFNVLGSEVGALVCDYYGIDRVGNFEGKSIPHVIGRSAEQFADAKGFSVYVWEEQLAEAREKLFERREMRVHPHKDDKILTAWNALMIAAFAKGAKVLQNSGYREAAERAVQFILTRLQREDGRLLARYRDGEAAHLAYVDDYAFFVWALHELYEATWDVTYLQLAERFNDDMLRLFWDEAHGGLYFTGTDGEQLLARPKEIYDGAIPSGNSVAAYNLFRLAHVTGRTDLAEKADQQLEAFAAVAERAPTGTAFFLCAVQLATGPMEMVVVAGDGQPSTIPSTMPSATQSAIPSTTQSTTQSTTHMLRNVQQAFLPGAVLLYHSAGEEGAKLVELAPSVAEQKMQDGQATAYICKNYACQAPLTDPAQLREQLRM